MQKQGEWMQGEQMQRKQRQGEQMQEEYMPEDHKPEKDGPQVSILIKPPVMYRMLGIGGMLFGGMMAFWCYSDYLQGNDTATVGIAVGFLVIPGILGLWLIFYSLRFVRIEGENILFRDILFRSHRFRMDEIRSVKWIGGAFVLMGGRGKLFRLYENSYGLERLFSELEKRGVEVDIPGRLFVSSRIAACHPCPDQRRFTVKFMACSIHFYGRLEIEGRRIKLCRFLKEDELLRISDLKEVRVRENKDKRFIISIYHRNGKRLVKLAGGLEGGADTNYVFALLRHLRDTGVPVYGLEETDAGMQCMMRCGFVPARSAQALFQEEYQRVLPVFREYETDCQKAGLKLVYGCFGRDDMADQKRIWEHQTWYREGVFPDEVRQKGLVYAFYFCVLKDGKVAWDRKRKIPLYQYFQIVSGNPGADGIRERYGNPALQEDGAEGLFYFLPVPEPVLRGMLKLTFVMVEKKRIEASDLEWER